jgi:hypothetical protein
LVINGKLVIENDKSASRRSGVEMFGNNDQDNQQQDNGAFGQPTTGDAMAMADGSLGNDNPANNSTGQPAPVNSFAQDVSVPPVPSSPPPGFGDSSSPIHNDELLSIKQGALHQLSPLVGHLDQTPEEKFRTTMMMIQASDDQSLIKAAYEAAQKISDDKARAQALLDVINEINYFTQQHNK